MVSLHAKLKKGHPLRVAYPENHHLQSLVGRTSCIPVLDYPPHQSRCKCIGSLSKWEWSLFKFPSSRKKGTVDVHETCRCSHQISAASPSIGLGTWIRLCPCIILGWADPEFPRLGHYPSQAESTSLDLSLPTPHVIL